MDAALEVLQTERRRKKAEEEEAADAAGVAEALALVGDHSGAVAVIQDDIAVDVPVDKVFDVRRLLPYLLSPRHPAVIPHHTALLRQGPQESRPPPWTEYRDIQQ